MDKKLVKDLQTLVRHSKVDMSYGGGGTFALFDKIDKDGEVPTDKKGQASAKRAISFIESLINKK